MFCAFVCVQGLVGAVSITGAGFTETPADLGAEIAELSTWARAGSAAHCAAGEQSEHEEDG